MTICDNSPKHSPIIHGGTICPLCAALEEVEKLHETITAKDIKIGEQVREIFSLNRQLERELDTNRFLRSEKKS